MEGHQPGEAVQLLDRNGTRRILWRRRDTTFRLRNTLYCSFCGKSQHEVKKLIAGPNYLTLQQAAILDELRFVNGVPCLGWPRWRCPSWPQRSQAAASRGFAAIRAMLWQLGLSKARG